MCPRPYESAPREWQRGRQRFPCPRGRSFSSAPRQQPRNERPRERGSATTGTAGLTAGGNRAQRKGVRGVLHKPRVVRNRCARRKQEGGGVVTKQNDTNNNIDATSTSTPQTTTHSTETIQNSDINTHNEKKRHTIQKRYKTNSDINTQNEKNDHSGGSRRATPTDRQDKLTAVIVTKRAHARYPSWESQQVGRRRHSKSQYFNQCIILHLCCCGVPSSKTDSTQSRTNIKSQGRERYTYNTLRTTRRTKSTRTQPENSKFPGETRKKRYLVAVVYPKLSVEHTLSQIIVGPEPLFLNTGEGRHSSTRRGTHMLELPGHTRDRKGQASPGDHHIHQEKEDEDASTDRERRTRRACEA